MPVGIVAVTERYRKRVLVAMTRAAGVALANNLMAVLLPGEKADIYDLHRLRREAGTYEERIAHLTERARAAEKKAAALQAELDRVRADDAVIAQAAARIVAAVGAHLDARTAAQQDDLK